MSGPGYGGDVEEDDDDFGYTTSYPNKYGGHHQTDFSRRYPDHFSRDTDRYGNPVPWTDHYSTDTEDEDQGSGYGDYGGG